MQIFFHLCAGIGYNVQRYGAVALVGGGMSFCRRTKPSQLFAYSANFVMDKNHDTRRESPAVPGRPVPRW